MAAPFEAVLARGSIFLWHQYSLLDDPALAGQSKAKFLVVLSTSPHDDPILYLLTASEKPQPTHHRFPDDVLRIPAGTYPFFPQITIIDVAESGQLHIGHDEFESLYDQGAVAHVGHLSGQHVAELMEKIRRCPRIVRRFKNLLGLA